MSWFNVLDGLKNKICRYLLQRYLGQFLEEQINLEQLKVELYNGKATVKNVSLKVEALNELFEAQGWAVEILSGTIGVLTVSVPWNALITKDTSIEVSDLVITLRPVKRQNDGTSMLESMWSSASSSIQLAEECMKQKDDGLDGTFETNANAIVGLEKFAETIDNVLNRIHAKFTNTNVRLEYSSTDGCRGVAVIVNILDLNYKNETGNEQLLQSPQSRGDEPTASRIDNIDPPSRVHLLPSFAKHKIVLNGLRIYTEECLVGSDAWRDEAEDEQSSSSSCDSNETKCRPFAFEASGLTRIPIIELREQQRIQIKMKQSEEISGPKVYLNLELGVIYTFLSPRQIHLLLAILDAFYQEEENAAPFATNIGNVKNEYSNNNFGSTRTGAGLKSHNKGIWSDDVEDNVLQNAPSDHNVAGNSSTFGRPSRYCDSLSSSMSSTTTVTGTMRFQRKCANLDSCGEILNFDVRIKSIVGIILQEDILVESNTNVNRCPLNEKSQQDMLHIAENFFAKLRTDFCENDLRDAKQLCKKNHLYVCTSPVFVDGIQQRNKSILVMQLSATATKFDFCEVLDGKFMPIVAFDRDENCSDGYHKRPEIKMNWKTTSSSHGRQATAAALDITLESCAFELDISIYDRLSALIGPSPFEKRFSSRVDSTNNKQEVYTKPSSEINIVSTLLHLKLRFPIVDTRPLHDRHRIPWWQQNIRKDFLLISFQQPRFKYNATTIDIVSNEIYVDYCEQGMGAKTPLLKTSLCRNEQQYTRSQPTFEYPKITIGIAPEHRVCGSTFTNRFDGGDMDSGKNQANHPFSSKRECRQSDTVHTKKDATEYETVLLPGETHEIHKFCAETLKTSKLFITINLPMADIFLESKPLYEVLYNRLNTDLLMWEPSSPYLKPPVFHDDSLMYQSVYQVNPDSASAPSTSPQDPYATFDERQHNYNEKLMRNANNIRTMSSESDESDYGNGSQHAHNSGAASESIYFSTHDSKHTQLEEHVVDPKESNCAVEIVVGRGTLALIVPVRDCENHIIPGQFGKFDIKLNNLKIFLVNGYKSDNNLGYMCLQLNDVEVYHCGVVPANYSFLQNFETNIADCMLSTFYKVPPSLTKGKGAGSTKREMISLVIEIKKVPLQRIKRLKITAGIQQAALRHNPEPSPHTWFNQLVDFFDVLDYPIEGYQPFGVITEIQLNLWDCAIDYRPKNLPYRAVVEIGSFTISSNIISSVRGCNLRFVVDECVLSLAPFDCSNVNVPDSKITCLESANLVPVLDIGLFDISLRLSDGVTLNSPQLDLRCSIHDFHLRTCFDSGSALAQLIAHIANDADFASQMDVDDECTSSFRTSVTSDSSIFASDEVSVCSEVTPSQQERVNLLMAEAVQESVTSRDGSADVLGNAQGKERGIELFYFPDEGTKPASEPTSDGEDGDTNKNELCDIINFESNVMLNSYYAKLDTPEDTLPQVRAELGNVDQKSTPNDSEDFSEKDDYCIIADEEKSLLNTCGIKNVKIPDDPLRIVDNHFCLPAAKPDLLRSPENFPTAKLRYTLCEMTFTWHLYGGKDFPEHGSIVVGDKKKTEKSPMSDAYKNGVSYSKGAHSIQFGKKPKEKITWKTKGGPQRNHEVLVEMQFSKVRLSHEIYPRNSSHASRQVLLVHAIEVRDRLQSSEMNKFLYHPSTKNTLNKNPDQMIVIKALHVRPNPQRSAAQECSLRISLLPMRLHIDQDTLVFLADFFTNFGDSCNAKNVDGKTASNTTKSGNAVQHQPDPIMTVDEVPEAMQDLQARKMVATNLDLLMANETDNSEQSPNHVPDVHTADESSPIYFREIIFSPDVSICFDYHGRRVEMSRGPVAGLLMGLGQLQCSEICLKKLTYRRGLLGMEKLVTYLCKEWLKDIRRNQLPKILSGVGPAHAFIQFFQGIYDLFWLPIEQYQKDGRLIRGLQLGAQSFTARTAIAALEITSRIIQLLQFTAETAFDMVSPGPSVKRTRKLKRGKKKRHHRPKDIREGVTNAYLIVKEGFSDSANTLIETAVSEHDQKGYTGAVGAVMRQIPQLVVCPAVLATQATTNILGGVKSSLVPEAKIEAREKWKDDSD